MAPAMWNAWRNGNIRALFLLLVLTVAGITMAVVQEGFVRIVERYAREVRRLNARDRAT